MTEPVAGAPAFEAGLAELESILQSLEDGSADLGESLARYERGVHLLRGCYLQLRDAELRVRQLAGVAEDGRPILKPFPHAPSRNGSDAGPDE